MITVQQEINQYTVQIQENQPITVMEEEINPTIELGFPTVVVEQVSVPITIKANFSVQNMIPFTFTAIQGQKVFSPLPGTPLSIWVFITGAGQNQAAGDFTVSGNVLTLSQGVNAGDTVYGLVQL